MKTRKVCGVDELLARVLKKLADMDKTEVLCMCYRIYEESERPEDFVTTVMIPIEKKKNTKKYEEYRTISLIPRATKVLLRTLNR